MWSKFEGHHKYQSRMTFWITIRKSFGLNFICHFSMQLLSLAPHFLMIHHTYLITFLPCTYITKIQNCLLERKPTRLHKWHKPFLFSHDSLSHMNGSNGRQHQHPHSSSSSGGGGLHSLANGIGGLHLPPPSQPPPPSSASSNGVDNNGLNGLDRLLQVRLRFCLVLTSNHALHGKPANVGKPVQKF